MSIKKRLFWSNIMMLVIPVIISTIISYMILFIFTRNSSVPMERAFPQAFGVMRDYSKDGDEVLMAQRVEEFNGLFMDSGVFIALVRDHSVEQPDHLQESLLVSNAWMQTVVLDEAVTGNITINDIRFSIEQIRDYRVILVDRSHRLDFSEWRRPLMIHLPLVFAAVIGIILLTNRMLTYLLTRKIMIPLNLLAEGARQLGQGNLSHRIEYKGKDEFTHLCDNFNAMAHQLQKLIERQHRDEESRKELLAGMSHDLRTPLTSIKAYVEGLLDGVAEDMPAQLRYLSIIRNKAEDIDRIVDKLFLFSKLDIDEFPFSLEKLDIGEELRAMAAAVEEESKGLRMVLEENVEGVYVETDALQFHNVLINVLENSLRYKNRDEVTVRVRCFGGRETVSIWLTDDGPGVSDEELQKIFDVFYRGDPSRQNPSKGSGLGLAISARIMERTGGAIHAESPPEGGLRIVLRLPVYKEKEGEVSQLETDIDH